MADPSTSNSTGPPDSIGTLEGHVAPGGEGASGGAGGGSLRELLAARWQVPLLIAGLLLLLTGLPRLLHEPPGETPAERISAARQALSEDRFEEAIGHIDPLLAEDLEPSVRAEVLLIDGLAHYGLASGSRDAFRRAHARQTIADLTVAAESAGSVEALDGSLIGPAEFFARRGQARLWANLPASLADAEADLTAAVQRLGPGQEALRKELIGLLWNVNPRVVHRELDAMMARTDLPQDEQIWAACRKAQLFSEEARLDEAVVLLEKRLEAAADAPSRDRLEVALAMLHYRAASSPLRPVSPAERDRWLDRAYLLLAAVDLRRSPQAGEEDLDAELHWLLGEVCFAQDRPGEAQDHFDRVVRNYASGRYGRVSQLGLARSLAINHSLDQAHAAYEQVVYDLKSKADDPLIDRRAVQDSLMALSEQLRAQEQWERAYRFLVLLADMLDPYQEKPSPTDVMEKQGVVLRRLAMQEKQSADRLLREHSALLAPAGLPEGVALLNAQARRHLQMAAQAFLSAAQSARKDDVRGADDLEIAATCYDDAGEIFLAIPVLQKFIEDYPSDRRRVAKAVFNLGRAYQGAGRYDQAVRQYQRMLDEFSQSPDANKSLVPMALCHKAMDQFDQAEQMLTGVLSNDAVFSPDSLEYSEALFELAKLKYERGQFRQAIARFDEALQRDPNHRQALYSRYYLADSYRLSGLELDAAIRSANTPPDRQQLVQTRTQWLTRARQLFDGAGQQFEARAGASDDLDELDGLYLRNSYFFRADCMFGLERYDEAIWLYDLAALRYNGRPEAVAAYVQIVNCYAKMGRPEQARTATERAKWLLRKLPAEDFTRRPLPLDREYFARWLDWMSRTPDPGGANPATPAVANGGT